MRNKLEKCKKNIFKNCSILVSLILLFVFLFTTSILADEDMVELYAPHFMIYFNKNINAPLLTSDVSGDLTFQFAAQVRSALVNAYDKYDSFPGSSAKGFKMPEENDVYIDDWGPKKTAEWDWFSKDIEIPVTYNSLKKLQHDAAHELFHAVQNQYIYFTSMHSYRWWMEATADYAAAYIGTDNRLINKLDLNYIKKPLNSGDEQHMYQTANFIKYLTDKGVDFKDLFETTMTSSGSVLSIIDSHLKSTGKTLGDYYNEFAVDFFKGTVNRKGNKGFEEKIVDDIVNFSTSIGTDSKTSSRYIRLGENCTTNITGFKMDENNDKEFNISILALEPTAGINVHYIVSSTEDPNDIVTQGDLAAGAKSAVKVSVKGGYHVYFVVSNADSKSGSVTVALETPRGNYSFSKERKVKVYNGTFNLKVNFRLSSSYQFKVVSEQTMLQHGELYRVELQLLEKIPEGKYATIDASVYLSDLSYVKGNDNIPVIGEQYWESSAGKTVGENVIVKYFSDSDTSLTMGHSVVINYRRPGGNVERWAGSGNLIYIRIRYHPN